MHDIQRFARQRERVLRKRHEFVEVPTPVEMNLSLVVFPKAINDFVQAFVASVSEDPASEATIAVRNARWAKVNAYFDPPQDEQSLTERLHLKRGVDYSVGSPESDDAAA